MTTLTTGQAKALLLIAAKQDVRSYLCGVFIDPTGYAVATDGHCMMAIRIEPTTDKPYTVSRGVLEMAAKQTTKHNPEIECSPTHLRYTTAGGTMDFPHTPIDGRYPEWQRAIPTACTGELAQFDSEILERMRKALDSMCSSKSASGKVFVKHNGPCAAGVIATRPDVVAVVMPMRDADKFNAAKHVAEFLKPTEAKHVKAA